VPASPARGYPLQAKQRAQFRRLSATGSLVRHRLDARFRRTCGMVGPCRPGCPWQCVPPGRLRRARPVSARVPVAICSPGAPAALCSSRARGVPWPCVPRAPMGVPVACRSARPCDVSIACLWRPVACPSFARMMRRTGSVAASIRRPTARLTLRAGPEGAPDAEPP